MGLFNKNGAIIESKIWIALGTNLETHRSILQRDSPKDLGDTKREYLNILHFPYFS